MNRSMVVAGALYLATLCSCSATPPGQGPGESVEEVTAKLTVGSWTMVANPYLAQGSNGVPAQPGTVTLLPDGRVLASGPEVSSQWYTLTPDAGGSYQNGTWVQVGASAVGRLFHPSFVLRDGRYWVGGGEYPAGNRATSEIFDPVTNSWAMQPDMPEEIADTPAALLGNGQLLVLSHASHASYIFDSFGVAPHWSKVASWSATIGDSESTSLLLPDGSVLAGTRQFQRYLPAINGWVDTALPPGGAGAFSAPNSDEMGPMVLLHDGRALVLGANQHSGLYTPPSVSSDPGSWTLAADVPALLNHGDAPSVVEPDGKVLSVVTNDVTGIGYAPAIFYEYDPSADTWTPIATPFQFDNAERVNMFPLPNGQIWVSGSGTGTSGSNAWLYTPAGTPQNAWRPQITSVGSPSFGQFTLAGLQLNGLTTGGDFGDDNKMTTNFPVVWLSDASGHAYYCRTYNFDQMAPRPNTLGSTAFRIPATVPDGAYTLHLSANGVEATNTAPIAFAGPRVVALTGTTGQAPGFIARMNVYLSAPAPAGGVLVNLRSTEPTVASVPSTITVPEGMTFYPITVSSLAFGNTAIQAATAANPSFGATRSFGWSLTGFSGPSGPSSGTTATWTVTIDKAALFGGVDVALTSSNPSTVSVPATVNIPQGATSATFVVNFIDPTGPQATLTASLIGSSEAEKVGYSITAHEVSPTPVPIGGHATGTITLNNPAVASGLLITLSNAGTATAPASILVPAGATQATYPINGVSQGIGYIRARIGTAGSFRSISFLVDYAIDGLTGPPVPAPGTSTALWTAMLGTGAPGAQVVTLVSSNPATASVPATVNVPDGAVSVTFPVTLLDVTAAPVTITAQYRNTTASRSFGYGIASHVMSPSSLGIGMTGTGTVTLNGPAPTGGLTLTLTGSAAPISGLPPSIFIDSGASTGTYTVTGLSQGLASVRARIGTRGAFLAAKFFVGF